MTCTKFWLVEHECQQGLRFVAWMESSSLPSISVFAATVPYGNFGKRSMASSRQWAYVAPMLAALASVSATTKLCHRKNFDTVRLLYTGRCAKILQSMHCNFPFSFAVATARNSCGVSVIDQNSRDYGRISRYSTITFSASSLWWRKTAPTSLKRFQLLYFLAFCATTSARNAIQITMPYRPKHMKYIAPAFYRILTEELQAEVK